MSMADFADLGQVPKRLLLTVRNISVGSQTDCPMTGDTVAARNNLLSIKTEPGELERVRFLQEQLIANSCYRSDQIDL